jgi:hypothetical protein
MEFYSRFVSFFSTGRFKKKIKKRKNAVREKIMPKIIKINLLYPEI